MDSCLNYQIRTANAFDLIAPHRLRTNCAATNFIVRKVGLLSCAPAPDTISPTSLWSHIFTLTTSLGVYAQSHKYSHRIYLLTNPNLLYFFLIRSFNTLVARDHGTFALYLIMWPWHSLRNRFDSDYPIHKTTPSLAPTTPLVKLHLSLAHHTASETHETHNEKWRSHWSPITDPYTPRPAPVSLPRLPIHLSPSQQNPHTMQQYSARNPIWMSTWIFQTQPDGVALFFVSLQKAVISWMWNSSKDRYSVSAIQCLQQSNLRLHWCNIYTRCCTTLHLPSSKPNTKEWTYGRVLLPYFERNGFTSFFF